MREIAAENGVQYIKPQGMDAIKEITEAQRDADEKFLATPEGAE